MSVWYDSTLIFEKFLNTIYYSILSQSNITIMNIMDMQLNVVIILLNNVVEAITWN